MLIMCVICKKNLIIVGHTQGYGFLFSFYYNKISMTPMVSSMPRAI
jgi:hypothetical protein